MSPPHTLARETEDARYDALLAGRVVDNDDPENLGRVRVYVPGVLDPESCWAWPIGAMRGVNNGIWWIPEVGSNVAVWLNQGDVDHVWYQAGPYGAPGGALDVQDQAGSPPSKDIMSIRWRGFHITFDGTDGAEKATLQDLTSGTKLVIDRSTGNLLVDVEGDANLEVKKDLNTTVEEGDETHTVTAGKRTTSIQEDDDKTIVAGDEVTTITAGKRTATIEGNDETTLVAGSEVKTITLGGSAETMPLGPKAITALTISLTATGAITLAGTSLIAAIVQVAFGNGALQKLLDQRFYSFLTTHQHPDPASGNTGAPIGAPALNDVSTAQLTAS